MSKHIKQMEMAALKDTFKDVRDLLILSSKGVDATVDNQVRLGLRKKNIRLQVVKNSLARRVFGEMGIKADKVWEGPTLVAWGGASIAELSREIDTLLKKNDKLKDKVKVKGAVAEGLEIPFARALTMPTRTEAIARIISLVLSPASRLVGQITGPGANLASQIKTISEKTPPAETPAPAAT